MVITDVNLNFFNKPCRLWGNYRCTGHTAYGDVCKRYATGRLDGEPACTAHFKPIKPRTRPSLTIKRIENIIKKRGLKNVIILKDVNEEQCPVCLDDYKPFVSGVCGHRVCISCLGKMKSSSHACPMCRDARFKDMIELTRM